jgi:hypothetical protein
VGVSVAVFVGLAAAIVGVFVRVGVALADGVRVAVLDGVRVGVLVPVGVRVAVGPEGVAVGVFVRVLVGVKVEVGVAVAPRVTDTTAKALLFPMRGSGSLPITPTTAVSVPCDKGTTRITRLLRPAAAQVTVVANSAEAVFAAQTPAGTDESNVTFGKNTAVTVTLAAPLDPHGECGRAPDRCAPRRHDANRQIARHLPHDYHRPCPDEPDYHPPLPRPKVCLHWSPHTSLNSHTTQKDTKNVTEKE